jgi:hypothetical protein
MESEITERISLDTWEEEEKHLFVQEKLERVHVFITNIPNIPTVRTPPENRTLPIHLGCNLFEDKIKSAVKGSNLELFDLHFLHVLQAIEQVTFKACIGIFATFGIHFADDGLHYGELIPRRPLYDPSFYKCCMVIDKIFGFFLSYNGERVAPLMCSASPS